MNMRDLIEKDIAYQERLIKAYSDELRGLPKGTLYLKRNRGKYEFYVVDPKSKKRKYIRKEQIALVEGLKKRRYLESALKVMTRNVEGERRLIASYKAYEYDSITSRAPAAYNLMKHYSGEVLHETTMGLKVRSKSEAIICEALYANGIEFEYERTLTLNKAGEGPVTFHPDFSFKNEVTGEWIYWEHLGMLSNERYKRDTAMKLITYADNEILPGKNLFITADTMDGRMDVRVVNRTIELVKSLL